MVPGRPSRGGHATNTFETGQRVRLPGETALCTVEMAAETPQGWQLFLADGSGSYRKVLLTPELAPQVAVVTEDGAAEPGVVLAGLWTEWMRAATLESKATTLATTPLRPYAHQTNAVYGSMLPQPRLRFLPADEPGTGKTIMAGMYLREMQRLGFVREALVICPAHLVQKWRADFERFFGGGLRRITADTVREGALAIDHDIWVTSLDLTSVNAQVQEVEAIRGALRKSAQEAGRRHDPAGGAGRPGRRPRGRAGARRPAHRLGDLRRPRG